MLWIPQCPNQLGWLTRRFKHCFVCVCVFFGQNSALLPSWKRMLGSLGPRWHTRTSCLWPQEEVLGSGLAGERTGAASQTHLGKDRCGCACACVCACVRVQQRLVSTAQADFGKLGGQGLFWFWMGCVGAISIHLFFGLWICETEQLEAR